MKKNHKLCATPGCKRKALYRIRGKYRHSADHELCYKCFLAMRDRVRVEEQEMNERTPEGSPLAKADT